MKKITIEKVILFLAAGFAAYNFGLAGGYIEGTHISIGGLIAGVVVNVSLAIAASRYGSIKGDKRTRQAQAAFYAMLALSPILVSPVVFYSLPETFLGHWIARAVWAVAWPLVADLAIVLAGAVSGKGLISLGETDGNLHGKIMQPAGQVGQLASKVAGKLPRQGKQVAMGLASNLQRQPVQEADLLAFWQASPAASDRQVAEHFHVSRQAIGDRRKALLTKGVIMQTDAGVFVRGYAVELANKNAGES